MSCGLFWPFPLLHRNITTLNTVHLCVYHARTRLRDHLDVRRQRSYHLLVPRFTTVQQLLEVWFGCSVFNGTYSTNRLQRQDGVFRLAITASTSCRWEAATICPRLARDRDL